jgi:hypothetical protein
MWSGLQQRQFGNSRWFTRGWTLQELLAPVRNSSKASIAMKMSWVSKRETEREKDMTYCLFGIFDVTMDVRYGVGGRKEFQRL